MMYLLCKCFIVIFALAVGCGPGVAEGPIPLHTEKDGSIEDTSSQGFTCPNPIESACGDPGDLYPALIAASQIDTDARIVALARNALLLERTRSGIEEPVVWIMDFEHPEDTHERGRAELPSRPSSPIRPIGLAYNLESPFDMDLYARVAVVLLESDEGSALYEAPMRPGGTETADLVPMENGVLPTEGKLRGLTYLDEKVSGDDSAYFDRLCAFGDGIFCFDGSSWTTEIEPGSGAMFNDLGVLGVGENNYVIAVGDNGRIALDSAAGWRDMDSGTAENLMSVSVHIDRFTAVGSNGILVDGTADNAAACSVSSETLIAINRLGAEKIVGVTESGKVFTGRLDDLRGELCYQGPSLGSAIDARPHGCDSGNDNYLVITSDFLYGKIECTIPL